MVSMKAILKKEFSLGYILLIIICMFIGFVAGTWYVHHTQKPAVINTTCQSGYTMYNGPMDRCVPTPYYNSSCFGGMDKSTHLCPL